jgi:hypothetical protein
MAKLRADMTYNQRLYQDSNIIIPNLEIIPQDNLENPDNNTAETEKNDLSSPIQENEEALENDNDDYDEGDIEKISKRFDENLAEWLEMLRNIEEESEFLDIDIEDIEHPAQNNNAKWNLDIIFKDDLCCPF